MSAQSDFLVSVTRAQESNWHDPAKPASPLGYGLLNSEEEDDSSDEGSL
jgi:hypothetical protein